MLALGAFWFRKFSVDFRRFRVFVFYHRAYSKTGNPRKTFFLLFMTWWLLWNFPSFPWVPAFPSILGIDLAQKEDWISTSSKFINLNIFHVLLYCKKVSQHHGFATFLENFGAFRDILILHKTIKQPENNIYYHFDFAILLKVCIFNVQVCNKLRILVKNWDLNTKLHCLRAICKSRY